MWEMIRKWELTWCPHLNDWNVKLQRGKYAIFDLISVIHAFQKKLGIFKRDIQSGLNHFPRLLGKIMEKKIHVCSICWKVDYQPCGTIWRIFSSKTVVAAGSWKPNFCWDLLNWKSKKDSGCLCKTQSGIASQTSTIHLTCRLGFRDQNGNPGISTQQVRTFRINKIGKSIHIKCTNRICFT